VCIYIGAMNNYAPDISGQPASQLADEILDKRETAKRIRKSIRTVDAWMKAKKLPYLKVGRTVLFRWSAILERLESFRVN
jgi:hypothetical protein